MSTKNFVSYGDAETLFSEVGNKIKNLDYGKLNVCSALPRNPIPGALYVAANWNESGSYPYNGRIYQYRLVLSTSQIDNTWKPVYLAKNIYYSLANGGSSDFKVGSYLFGSTPGKDAYGSLRLDVCAVVSRIYNDVMGITYADLTKLDASGKPNSYTDTINDIGGGFSSTSYYGKMMWMEVGEKLSIVSNVYNLPPYNYNPNDVVLYTGQDYTDIKNLLWTKGHIYQCIDKNGNWTDITPVSSGGGTKYYKHRVRFRLKTPLEYYNDEPNSDYWVGTPGPNGQYVTGMMRSGPNAQWTQMTNIFTPGMSDDYNSDLSEHRINFYIDWISPISTSLNNYDMARSNAGKLLFSPMYNGTDTELAGMESVYFSGNSLVMHRSWVQCGSGNKILNGGWDGEKYFNLRPWMITDWTDTVTEWTA